MEGALLPSHLSVSGAAVRTWPGDVAGGDKGRLQWEWKEDLLYRLFLGNEGIAYAVGGQKSRLLVALLFCPALLALLFINDAPL